MGHLQAHHLRSFLPALPARAASWPFAALLFLIFAGWDDGATSLFMAAIVPIHVLGAIGLWYGCKPEERHVIAPVLRLALALPMAVMMSG